MKRTKKIMSFLLSIIMLFSVVVPTALADESTYGDTNGHWAEKSINRWSGYGIVEGDGENFNPDDSVTRSQMATILSKTLGLTDAAENPFSDVADESWYAPYILRCFKAGIMLGDNGTANPDAKITRQEAMTMFCRAFSIEQNETADLSAFKDSADVASWALPYVSALINGGIVGGVSDDMLAPNDSMSRAALVTILDRAIIQFINVSGEYDLAENGGIILVAAGDVTLKGKTEANILVTAAANGKTLTFSEATVTGKVTLQANTEIVNNNSTLPEANNANKEEEKEPTEATATPAPVKKVSSGGGGGGSSRRNSPDLVIDKDETVTGGTYSNVTISSNVGDGEVTLASVIIKGDLTVNGGGSSSVKLNDCDVQGKVVINKESGETPRLELTNTPINQIDVQSPAIIETTDNASSIDNVDTTSDVELRGENTSVNNLNVSEDAENPVNIKVANGRVSTLAANSATTVTGSANSVNTVVASSDVTADSSTVQNVKVPETAEENVNVTITGDETVDVEVNSENGATVTGNNVTVSSSLETTPENVTVNGNAATHIHKWSEPTVTDATCEKDGLKEYTCIAEGCTDPAATKTEIIKKLGHNWNGWTKADDESHSRTCKNDAEHIQTEKHTWNGGVVTTEATETTEGVKTFTCTVCGATKTEAIPASGATGSTETQITVEKNENGDIVFTCPTYGKDQLCVMIQDSNGEYMWSRDYNTDAYELLLDDVIENLAIDEGTAAYSIVIYAGTYISTDVELDRLDNAIILSVEGEAVEYDMVYNDGEAGKHTVNFADAALTCEWYYTDWTGGTKGDFGFHYPDDRNAIGESTGTWRALQYGDVLDIRLITGWELEEMSAKVTITPPSRTTYTIEDGEKLQWNDAGSILWQPAEKAESYKVNLYFGDGLDEVAPCASRVLNKDFTTYDIDDGFDLPYVANYSDAMFTVDVQALDAEGNVIETVGTLPGGIIFTFYGPAPTVKLDVSDARHYSLTFDEESPKGSLWFEWNNPNFTYNDGGSGWYKAEGADVINATRHVHDFTEGDSITLWIVGENTATTSVWTFSRTSKSTYNYVAE